MLRKEIQEVKILLKLAKLPRSFFKAAPWPEPPAILRFLSDFSPGFVFPLQLNMYAYMYFRPFFAINCRLVRLGLRQPQLAISAQSQQKIYACAPSFTNPLYDLCLSQFLHKWSAYMHFRPLFALFYCRLVSLAWGSLICQFRPNLNRKYMHVHQSSLNKSTAQNSVTAKSVVDSAEQFEFRPIRSSKFQNNQPVAFKIQIFQLILMY